MRKVVINRCYGGFSLSRAAVHAIAARKGITLYTTDTDRAWWTVPPEKRPQDERKAWTREFMFFADDIDRTDPDLVAVVEELGDKADGTYAKLKVVEVPDDVSWSITEYDGSESVEETRRTWR